MGFSIHLEPELIEALDSLARREHRSRNAIIREAVRTFLDQHQAAEWPRAVRELAGAAPDLERFESHRSDLSPTPDDPLA